MDTSDILQPPEDQIEWDIQEIERKQSIKDNIEQIKLEKANHSNNWLVWKIYYMLYSHPVWDKEVHINRVKPIIEGWLSVTTYEQLLEARIIEEKDIINNYKQEI